MPPVALVPASMPISAIPALCGENPSPSHLHTGKHTDVK